MDDFGRAPDRHSAPPDGTSWRILAGRQDSKIRVSRYFYERLELDLRPSTTAFIRRRIVHTPRFVMGLSSRVIAALTCAMYIVGLSSAWPQDVFNQKLGFDAKTVTPLVAIREIGLQSHVPIGIVFGANQPALCTGRVSFTLHEVTPRDALLEAVRSANYSVEEKDGIILLMAPDINSHQRTLLTHRFKEFRTEAKQTMHGISAQLTGWLWVEVDGAQGYGESTGDSTTAHTFNLPILEDVTTEQIADRIVTIPPTGMWILQGNTIPPLLPAAEGSTTPSANDSARDKIDFYSWSEPDQVRRDLICPEPDRQQ
jgi:hypothetical protein